jgi:hypothetical protein
MFKQSLFLLLSFLTLSLVAMEESKNTRLKPSVQAVNSIIVNSLKQSWNIPITATTTILDIKNWLLTSEGILVEQQHLSAQWKEWFFWYKHSLELQDTENTSNIMNIFNTNQFILRLKLRTINNNN